MQSDERYRRRITALDQGFKTVVHDSDVLSWLLRSNLEEFRGRSIEEIKSCLNIGEDGRTVIGRETEFDSPEHGKILTDSVFDVRIPGTDEEVSVILNIECQSDPDPGYPIEKRAEYYMARLVSSQKGTVFANDDYGRLRRVYSIWYIIRPRAFCRNTVVRYRMESRVMDGVQFDPPRMDTFNIIMVNVGRYDSSIPDDSAFPAILLSEMSMDERQELMENKFNIRLDDSLKQEVDSMASLGEDTYRHGVRVGKAEGRTDEKADTIIRLVKEEGWSLEKAMEFAKVTDNIRSAVEERVRSGLAD